MRSALADTSSSQPACNLSLKTQRALQNAPSDLHAEDCDDADVGRLAQLHGDQTIRFSIPEGTCCGGNRGSIVLLNDARYNILEFFVQFSQILNATLDDLL